MKTIKFRQPIFDSSRKFKAFHYWGFLDGINFTQPAVILDRNQAGVLSQQLLNVIDNKELYEGDIVTDTLPLSNDLDFENAIVVTIWNWGDVMSHEIVIGNIYETPNLVTQ